MLDIVVPVYNEEKNISHLFDEVEIKIREEKELLIVYDFDEDSTLPVVDAIKERYSFKIILVKNTLGRGVVNAIKVGLRTAVSEMVLIVMADLSDDLDVVDGMCDKMRSGYDVVCGSRYMKGGEQNNSPFLKGLMSRTAGRTLHILSGIPTHDVTNSFKLYRKSMLDSFTLESTGGFEIGMEICVKAYINGYRVTEVPSVWWDRTEGESHFRLWQWLPHYLHWYFLCIGRVRPVLRQMLFYSLFGLLCAMLDVGLYALIGKLIPYLFANIVSVSVATAVSFSLNRRFNFKVKDKVAFRLVSFFLVALLGLGLSELIIYLFSSRFGFDYLAVKIVSVICVAVFQFTCNKFITFKCK